MGECSLYGCTSGRAASLPQPQRLSLPLRSRCLLRHADLCENPHGENHHPRGESPQIHHLTASAGQGRRAGIGRRCPFSRRGLRSQSSAERRGLVASQRRAAVWPRPVFLGVPWCAVSRRPRCAQRGCVEKRWPCCCCCGPLWPLLPGLLGTDCCTGAEVAVTAEVVCLKLPVVLSVF